jgi:hypothetical protein
MAGAPLVAGWIAHLAFWALLAFGLFTQELRPRSATVFLGVWGLGSGLCRSALCRHGRWFVAPFVAVLESCWFWCCLRATFD